MDNYDENLDELDETSSSNSVNLPKPNLNMGKIIQTPKKIGQTAGKTTENTGKAVQTTGKAVHNTGKAVQATGKAVETSGKVAQKAGQVTQKAGQGIGKAGDSMMESGKALSSSGYGAIAGIPLAVLGGLTKAAGVGTEVAGKGTEMVGKGAEAAGKGAQKAGQSIEKAGDDIDRAGKAIADSKKNVETAVKGGKRFKKILAITGAVFPLVLIFALLFATAVAAMLPLFATTTFVGGKTVYGSSASDLPTSLTQSGIDTWSEEEKQVFEMLKKEKDIFDNDFKKYNASGILTNENEILDVVMPISTIHYMGTVNLNAFDEKYNEEVFTDGSSSLDYNGETNVQNKHTRDFYQKSSLSVGNTFMIYPGLRMLNGYLVGNEISFSYRQYEEKDGKNNASDIYSDWSYLGKITSSNATDASRYHSVSSSIGQMTSAINNGKNLCNSHLTTGNIFDPSSILGVELGNNEKYSMSAQEYYEFLKANVCYDVDSLYDEIFGEKFDEDIVTYLNDRFKDNKATVPTGTLVNGRNYITVSVNKKIDYDKYQNYLKDVYIPYYYINCKNCKYKDASEEVKKSQAESTLEDIMQFTNTFKYYNNEGLIGIENNYGNGTATISGISYQCGEYVIGITGEDSYDKHNANDITSTAPQPNIYPLMKGEVVGVYNGCSQMCPYSDAITYTMTHSTAGLNPACSCGGGWGNHVRIQSTYEGKTIYATYAHLSEVNVQKGQKVNYDTILGKMGNTGVSTGRHLHVELNYGNSSKTKFPATKIFTPETVMGTVCERNMNSGDNSDEED